MLFGAAPAVDLPFSQLQECMQLRSEGRLETEGDQCKFMNRTILRTRCGIRVRGNLRIMDAGMRSAGVEHCKYMGTPSGRYSISQIEQSPLLQKQ